MKKEKLEKLSLELGMKFDETRELFSEETLNSMKLFSLIGEGDHDFGTCRFGSCKFKVCDFGNCGDLATTLPPWAYCIDFKVCEYIGCGNTTQSPV